MNPVPITFDERVMQTDGAGKMVADGKPISEVLAPGAAWWSHKADGTPQVLHFVCPCGCGTEGGCPVYAGSGGWTYIGLKEMPTLQPSVRMISKCGWHGFLTNGIWTPC